MYQCTMCNYTWEENEIKVISNDEQTLCPSCNHPLEKSNMTHANETYNYRIKEWTENTTKQFQKECAQLKPANEKSFAVKEIICPIDFEADEAYYGSIMAWQNRNHSYTIGFFFGYYCGDTFFERITTLSPDELESLPFLIEKLYHLYCKTEMIDEIIRDKKRMSSCFLQ